MSDERIEILREKVRYHAKAYSTDIFKDITMEEAMEHSPFTDRCSAKMGRHMCKIFLQYIDEVFHEPEERGES
jgi:hypothetical protein